MMAIVPWIAARPDGASIDEVCTRFAIGRNQLLADLERVSMVGVAPYTPDLLVEVLIEDDRVWVVLPVAFDRPLQLTPDEGLALLVAGASVLSVPGADPDGPLARGLGRLAGLLGVTPGDALQVSLGEAEDATMSTVQEAISGKRPISIDYYSYGRDEHAVRTVDPHRIWADAGQWYLAGFCHLAQDERVFRLDRMTSVDLLDGEINASGASSAPGSLTVSGFVAGDDIPRVRLELSPPARWVLEHYPVEHVEETDGGSVVVTLAVTAVPWLERLLLRLGTTAEVIQADDPLDDVGRRAAERVLARYR